MPACRMESPPKSGGFLSFIVPTSGRSSLLRTLQSLQAQQSQSWRALIVLDNRTMPAPAAAVIHSEWRMTLWELASQVGCFNRGHGQSGSVRNLAFNCVRTPWLGFVDDDDTVGPDYTSLVEQYALEGWDSIAFRMRWAPWGLTERPPCFGYGCTKKSGNSVLSEVIPEWNASFIQGGHTGISFAMRTNLTQQGFRFGQAYTEDFGLQQALFGRKKRVLLAPQVTYYVKSVPRPEPVQGRYVENPHVCKSCPRSREAALSDEFALARLAAAEQGGGYDYHRRQLVAQHCDVRKPKNCWCHRWTNLTGIEDPDPCFPLPVNAEAGA